MILTSLIAFTSISIVGCGSGGGGSSSDTTPSNMTAIAPSDIKGSWKLESCTEDDGDGVKIDVLIEDGKESDIWYYFDSDTSCSNALSYTLEINTTNLYGPKINLTDANDAYNIDLTNHVLSMTPKNDSFATDLNNAVVCGFTDWSKDITKNVTTCFNQGADYDVYGVISGKLYWGNQDGALDGSTSENRPNALETSVGFIR